MTARARKQTKQKDLKEFSKKKQKQSSNGAGLYLMVILVLLVSVGVVWYLLSTKSDGVVTFARADNSSRQLTYSVTCSSDYAQDPFPECKPRRCGRVVMDGLVTEEEASYLLGVAKRGLSYGGSSGGASILDLHSGALSKGDKFVNVYSVLPEEDSFTEKDFEVYRRRVKDKIHQAIAQYFDVPVKKLYLTKPTFFSRMNTSEAKTMHDEYWHPHIDKVTYGSFHYTSLLYLSTYGQDFTGGRFVFVDKAVNSTVEPRLGRVSFFTSGSENLHFVEKLQSGTRYAITISFTCDPESRISDLHTR